MLLESAPFVLAGAIVLRAPWRWSGRAAAYLGCGCGTGPSARSLPAAAAAWITFGPLVAAARLAGAILTPLFPAIMGAHAPQAIVFGVAALAAFISSPCGLGTIGIAAIARTL